LVSGLSGIRRLESTFPETAEANHEKYIAPLGRL
jgi:hypothetical protein